MTLKGFGAIVGKPALDFVLEGQGGQKVSLREAWSKSNIMLVFYPGDFTMVCTAQLCNYRDSLSDLGRFGLEIYGISPNPASSHDEFAKKYDLPFTLLSDPSQIVAKAFGCQSMWMLGKVSRAVFIINTRGFILYRYVEPTILSRRKAGELVEILEDLSNAGLLTPPVTATGKPLNRAP